MIARWTVSQVEDNNRLRKAERRARAKPGTEGETPSADAAYAIYKEGEQALWDTYVVATTTLWDTYLTTAKTLWDAEQREG